MSACNECSYCAHCQRLIIHNHIFAIAPLVIFRTASEGHLNQHLSKLFLFLLLVTSGSICVSQLCSQPVEGGGHRLRTELEESLTEDDAGADQCKAAGDGGDHNSQDQGCRHRDRWSRALMSRWRGGAEMVN